MKSRELDFNSIRKQIKLSIHTEAEGAILAAGDALGSVLSEAASLGVCSPAARSLWREPSRGGAAECRTGRPYGLPRGRGFRGACRGERARGGERRRSPAGVWKRGCPASARAFPGAPGPGGLESVGGFIPGQMRWRRSGGGSRGASTSPPPPPTSPPCSLPRFSAPLTRPPGQTGGTRAGRPGPRPRGLAAQTPCARGGLGQAAELSAHAGPSLGPRRGGDAAPGVSAAPPGLARGDRL